MKEYEKFLLENYDTIKKENHGIVNTAKDHEEGFNVLVSIMKRRTNADENVIRRWLKEELLQD